MKTEEIIELDKRYYMNIFGERIPLVITHGKGCRVWDKEGREYLDFLAGIAVNALGHNHPAVSRSIKEQAEKLLHCSSLYYIESQARLAAFLAENSCADRVFFINSGAEANEGAIKLARKYGKSSADGKYEIITMQNSFHGRTLATLAATGQEKYQRDFTPLTPGFKTVPFNDLSAVKEATGEKTCAVMVEPIQGESGIHPAEEEFLKGLRELCDQRNMLLIMDEIQTGIGRCGDLFAHESYGVEPDIFTLAKGMANGIPIGSVLARGEAAETFKPGDHGSTFGGNPLACSAALTTLKKLTADQLHKKSKSLGDYFITGLREIKKELGIVKEVRGRGLMIGMEFNEETAPEILKSCREKGLLINAIGSTVLRFLPPLTVTRCEIDRALEIIREGIKEHF